ncbi:TonB-dependent receptor [Thalassobaculum sp. OXR-137]|uniref:TonB-dependent receptor domain-containing protein n=1 Tax=Thalassobaculum sp. OXR-137 TaxID=3100173 RepID=UPI002AC9634C|nr:TonB-dependent receptor [Thalassobaculum sp. OXR-137]WPZ33541.1 TonB-dependent receptor [Thalassobaculum sp. OXR-137]
MTFQNRPISGRSLRGAALIAALVAAGALPVQAQQAKAQQLAAGERATVATSNEVVVTASRIAETADETLAPVSVVTRAEIERRQIRSVPDALRQVPGLTLSNNGGVGKATSVFLRGTESDHVLVLINGVKVGSATLGTFNFESLSIDDVERIEVVRGPRSHLYGSEALGGIIQIFTRKPTDATHAHASVGYGSNDTMEGTAGFSGRASGIGFSASTNYIRTDGINSCGNGTAIPGGGCFANQPDKDGFERSSVTGGLDYAFSNGIKVEATGLYATSENEYDGSASNESESVNYVLGLRALASPTDYWDVTASAGHTVDDSDNFFDGTYQSTFKTERNVLSLQNDLYLLQDHVTTLGVDFQRDQVDSDTGYVEDSRDNTGVFAQHRAEFGRHTVQLSGRVDENEQFGGYLTGGAAYGYRITDNLRATASYGTAFKAPSFNELYYPGFGNADLDPEMSESAEIGLAATVGGFELGANLFHTEIDDLIAYDSSIFAPANVDKARITGLELTVSGEVAGFLLSAGATFLDPVNASGGANDGNLLPRRAEQVYTLSVDRELGGLGLGFGEFAVGGDVHHESERYDDLANTRTLDAYTTVDLRASWDATENWGVGFTLSNIFDEDYKTASFYNQQGRAGFLRLTYRR